MYSILRLPDGDLLLACFKACDRAGNCIAKAAVAEKIEGEINVASVGIFVSFLGEDGSSQLGGADCLTICICNAFGN